MVDAEIDKKLHATFDMITGLAAGLAALICALPDDNRDSARQVLARVRDGERAARPTLASVIDVIINEE